MTLIQVAIDAARQAGELLIEGFGTSYQIENKEGLQNLVTEYDHKSQKLIIQTIKNSFPTHHFLAEEGNVKELPSEEILWIIDPLDGTVNFAHNVPIFAVSIAAAKGSDILCGVIYNPMLGELFVTEKGQGAYLNDQKLQVTKQTSFERALFATGFPYNVVENPLHCIERLSQMLKSGIAMRRIGVAAIDLAYVAAGRFDVFWEAGLHPWDMAAGKLMIEEAGGKVTHFDGTAHKIYDYLPLLATNGLLHDSMVSILKEDL